MKTNFTEMLIAANGIAPEDFQSWVFCENMTFNAPGKWWGDYGQRDFPHEGIDLCLYIDGAGRLCRLDEQTRIPAMHDGVVKAMFNDYLGRAVIIEHDAGKGEKEKYLSAYAHTTPRAQIQLGAKVKRGCIIATIADTRKSKANILPHLHYSLGRPSPDLVYDHFVWNFMLDRALVTLLDPMEMIDGPCQVLASQDHRCHKALGQ
jgi:murein DD-endopeptidase MepM/ murein hydrolase activator NlpD